MTTKQQHTELPWESKEGMIYDKSGHTIAITSLSVAADPEENAAFIVRACNSHEALVDVVAELVAMCDSGTIDQFGYRADQWRKRLGKQARAALAKAGGK